MSNAFDLVVALKAELRRSGITYAHLARELGLAESSVKRVFAKGDLSLSRINQVLAVLGMDFADLARQVANASPTQQELSVEQEEAVVRDPKLLLSAICVLSQWSLEQIVDAYRITRVEATACLLALDRLGILELRPNNRYRLRIDKTFRWRPDGPVMRYFRRHAMTDYFDGDFGGDAELLTLVHGQIGVAQAQLFNDRLRRLAQDFAQQHLADQKLPERDRRAYTVVIGMRGWLFGAFRQLLREPPAGQAASTAPGPTRSPH